MKPFDGMLSYLRFWTQYVEQIPIPNAAAAERAALAGLVEQISDSARVG